MISRKCKPDVPRLAGGAGVAAGRGGLEVIDVRDLDIEAQANWGPL